MSPGARRTLAAVTIGLMPAVAWSCSSSSQRDQYYGTDAGQGYTIPDAAASTSTGDVRLDAAPAKDAGDALAKGDALAEAGTADGGDALADAGTSD